MHRQAIRLGVAAALAGSAVFLAVLGAIYNPIIVAFAAPVGLGAYLVWADVTGRPAPFGWTRWTARRPPSESSGPRPGPGRRSADTGSRGSRRRQDGGTKRGRSRQRARRVLGVEADASEREIARAYRERVKEVHPDADGGDEEAFKRVTEAYEQLVEE